MSASSIFSRGNVAVLSGAASGIGYAFANLCKSRGMKVVLIDNNKELLSKAKDALGEDTAEAYEMDVSKVDQWEQLREDVKKKYSRLDILLLNAGVATKGQWNDHEYFKTIMDVNLFGQINGLNVFLPMLQAQTTPSTIIMTGSKQGITNPPGNPAYNASKSAIKTLAEHLSFDLRGSQTSVHLLVPGLTFTGLHGGDPWSTKEKPSGAWTPQQCVEFLERKMQQGQFYVLCPDNDVTEDLDRRRMLYAVGDAIYGRQPLSRWREETKSDAEEAIKSTKY